MTDHEGHDGEKLPQALDRLGDDLEDPLDRHSKSRGRLGWKDIPHAMMNVFVTWCRDLPHQAGHWFLYTVLALVVVLLAVVLWGMLK